MMIAIRVVALVDTAAMMMCAVAATQSCAIHLGVVAVITVVTAVILEKI